MNWTTDTAPSEMEAFGDHRRHDFTPRPVVTPPQPPINILTKALEVTSGERQVAYGSPLDNWTRTVDIFNAMTGHTLTVDEGVKFAIAMKLARLLQTPNHRDSMVDLAGYAWVLSEVVA